MTARFAGLRSRMLPGGAGAAPRGARDVGTVMRTGAFVLAVAWLALVVAWSAVPGLFTSFDPSVGVTADKFLPPSTAHLFGTDYLGRDLFARVAYGARGSVAIALLAVGIGVVVGSAIGLAGGFFEHAVDAILGRFVDVLLAIPSLLLAVVIVVSLGFATLHVAIAVGVSSIAVFARLMRSEVMRVKKLPFVESSFLIGGTGVSTLLHHVLPHTFRSVLALAVLQFGAAILVISGLAFLGYGDPPPSSDWGYLVAEGKNYLPSYLWLVTCPGAVIVLTVLALNRISLRVRGAS